MFSAYEYFLLHACGQRGNETFREGTAANVLPKIALERLIAWYKLILFSRNTNFIVVHGAAYLFRMDRMLFNNALSTSYLLTDKYY